MIEFTLKDEILKQSVMHKYHFPRSKIMKPTFSPRLVDEYSEEFVTDLQNLQNFAILYSKYVGFDSMYNHIYEYRIKFPYLKNTDKLSFFVARWCK